LLTHPTHEALSALKLDGMAEAFAELITEDRGRSLDPVAWIGLMLDREQARLSISTEPGPRIGVEKGPLFRGGTTRLTRRSFPAGAGVSGALLGG
jgi:hypothetical protein